MESVNILPFIGVVGTICGIVFGYLGYQKGIKKDSYTFGIDKGRLKADMAYLIKRSDDMSTGWTTWSGISEEKISINLKNKPINKKHLRFFPIKNESEGVFCISDLLPYQLA